MHVCVHVMWHFSVAIYDVTKGAMTAMFEGQSGGVTHVVFSKDGNYLFAGGRKVRWSYQNSCPVIP